MAETVQTTTARAQRSRWSGWTTKWRRRPHGRILGVVLDGPVLRVVEAVLRGGRTRVSRVASSPLDLPSEASWEDPKAVGLAVAQALAQLHIKPGDAVMGVPRASVILRTLLLPPIDDLRELAAMVQFQISKELPFPVEDAVIDFKVGRHIEVSAPHKSESNDREGPSSDDGQESTVTRLEVLVAVAKREVVVFHEQVAAAAGLKLLALGLRSYANARCVEACQVAAPDEAVALVSLRPGEVNIDVILQQTLLFSRSVTVNLPPATSTQREGIGPTEVSQEPAGHESVEHLAFVGTITIEVVRTLHSYGGMESHSPVRRLVVAGATGWEEAVVRGLRARLHIPCEVLEPVAALQLEETPPAEASGAISALGLCLSLGDPQGLPFDFLNPKRPAVERNWRRIQILSGAAAVLVLFGTLFGIRSYLLSKRMAVYRQLQSQIAQEEKKRPIYRRMLEQARSVREWADRRRNWLEHYAYLSAVLPPCQEIYISSFSVGSRNNLQLTLQARRSTTLTQLDRRLRAAGYEIKPLAITPGADKYGYNFRSSVELLAPATLRADWDKLQVPQRPEDDGSLDPPHERSARRRKP